MVTVTGVALCSLLLLALCFFSDEHRSVTRRMGWLCTGIRDTTDPNFLHVESIKLWFVVNPHYEESASGPSLCADLRALGQPDVVVTFDTWGNKFMGLHGYNTTKISVGTKQLKVYGAESSGFHDDTGHYGNFNSEQDKKLHPEKYRFPLDTFR
jgi:hypothetical protein